MADSVLEEVVFGWPMHSGGLQLKGLLASRLQKAITSVNMPFSDWQISSNITLYL